MPAPPRGDFMPGIFFGAGFFELTSLNDRLAAHGYDRIESFRPVLGGELRAIHPSGLVTGIYGAAIFARSADGPDGLRAKWSGGFGVFEAGYAFVHLPAFTLSLSGGIGGYGVTLDIADPGGARFDSVLDMPRRGTSLTNGGLLFGLMLRADGRIPLGPVRNERQGYLAIGLRVNGLWGPALGDWGFEFNDDDATRGPSSNLAGVYAALVLGWGGTSVNPTP